ncbi:glycine--tRNA ligase subunit beta [Marinibactrum halimedae]|uniref:Glycine--tRNA ligase beta subunit n=1 Tax=Marinibactrum halimedae TaxID=1444977 RepID=A0AA37T751_9GAMM|nr:glycine--tRNA ligase subunit beta [Marinibactrum halimedae]MCD9460033.1 glycine--tRNA ligase subunit beta [Marinibactrum halimedae]GLS28199.1 glycine--tRNA ligase beta subunit [Marinibactrum halimedae]
MSNEFLVELGTEELPPKALKSLSDSFADGIIRGLSDQQLGYESVSTFASPRRLAVFIKGLDDATPKKEVVVWGPPAKIAFDDSGSPTKAAQAFASKNGIEVSELKTENDGKADKLVHRKVAGGEATTSLLPVIVEQSLNGLPIPKRMRWGARRDEFVRPVHWLVMLFGDQVIDTTILGCQSGNVSQGHRFHCAEELVINHPNEYESLLETKGHVIASFEKRRDIIVEQVQAQATSIGAQAVIESDLLDEVTALVEWPQALTGRFDERFLSVPAEALISSMKEHQKYFHVVDDTGHLMPNFITVANIISTDPQQVISGNERVIRPRLADAAFFFETDKKTTLGQQRDKLKNIVFQAQLGSVYQKTERVAALAKAISAKLGQKGLFAERAGELCKSDLVTEMVLEFDNMQGIAGLYYAMNDGEPEEVAQALAEQYLPRFAGDELPSTDTGTVLALADRLDTIVGIFGIGQIPSGSKDPFALRRASLGVLRLIIEKRLDLDLAELIDLAKSQYNDLPKAENVKDSVLTYMLDRLRAWYEDAGISAEVYLAVHAKSLSTPTDIHNRIYAVAEFSKLDASQALAAANKRVSNILTKAEATYLEPVNEVLLQEDAEVKLADALVAMDEKVAPLLAKADYTDALAMMAELREPVDAFFDNVMVMADDPALQTNRLSLLAQLRALFLEVADISLLVPAKG